MGKLLTFQHNGIEYINFDVEDEDNRQRLIKEMGEEKLEKIIAHNIKALDPVTQLQLAVADLYEEVHSRG